MTLRTTSVYVFLRDGNNEPDDGVAVTFEPIGGGGHPGLAFIDPDAAILPYGVTVSNKAFTVTTANPSPASPTASPVLRLGSASSLRALASAALQGHPPGPKRHRLDSPESNTEPDHSPTFPHRRRIRGGWRRRRRPRRSPGGRPHLRSRAGRSVHSGHDPFRCEQDHHG